MEQTLIPFNQMDAAGLAQLAGLHVQVMHTLLSELGEPLVLRYYQAAQKQPGIIGLCALGKNGEVEGWAMGSPDPPALNARLRQPLGWFAGQMLRLALTRPAALWHLLGSLLNASAANALAHGEIELTYIGVAPAAQGHGLGGILLGEFCSAARKAGYTSTALSVETDNPAALRLYTRSGFQVTRAFREGRFERQRMALRLI